MWNEKQMKLLRVDIDFFPVAKIEFLRLWERMHGTIHIYFRETVEYYKDIPPLSVYLRLASWQNDELANYTHDRKTRGTYT